MIIDIPQLIQECSPRVGLKTMQAIIKTESGGYPWAINVNSLKKSYKFSSKAEAIYKSKIYISAGYSVDMGLAQINSKNLPKLGLTVEKIFDPCINLQAASSILWWGFSKAKNKYSDPQKALLAAISAYNTGDLQRGFSNGYVGKVLNASNSKLIYQFKILDNYTKPKRLSNPHVSYYNSSLEVRLD